jgi:Domain of unknown function DUF29
MSNALYDRDFDAWANEQDALLRAGRLGNLDLENLIEGVESLARREKRDLINRLAMLLLQLLKWRYLPSARGGGLRLSIKEQRYHLHGLLRDSPSLTAHVEPALRDASCRAHLRAAIETGLAEDAFPVACPLTFEQATSDDWGLD